MTDTIQGMESATGPDEADEQTADHADEQHAGPADETPDVEAPARDGQATAAGGAGRSRRRSTSRRSGSRRSGSRRDVLTRGQARTALRVVAAVRDADDTILATAQALATVTGGGDDLAVAVLTGRADAAPQSVRDVAEIASADEQEAPVVAGMLGRRRLQAAWTLARATGVGLSVELPDADVKAALALARAIRGRTDDQVAVLDAATDLLAS